MFSLFFFLLTVAFTLIHLIKKKKPWNSAKTSEIFLSYFLVLNMGIPGIMAAIAHIFYGPETARMIGWAPGSPFQFEIGMANLAFGVLGLLCYWRRGRFWEAAIIGWSIFLLGCFAGHIKEFYVNHDAAPWNIGFFIWFNDLVLPIVALTTLCLVRDKEVRS